MKLKLSNFDKTLLLLVFSLAIGVAVISSALGFFNVISDETSILLYLMAAAWWFGAIMTYGFDRLRKNKTPL